MLNGFVIFTISEKTFKQKEDANLESYFNRKQMPFAYTIGIAFSQYQFTIGHFFF